MNQPRELPALKVAIVHDWLVGGGAELVVEQLHHMFPEAPIYTSYATKEWRERLDGKVVTGWLQPLGKIRKFIPVLRIWWFTHLKFEDYDLVISSSGAEAKGIRVPADTLHINYCHAPTHYYWSRYDEYMQHPGFGIFDPIARIGLKLLVQPLRKWDYKAAQRPSSIIANSTHIKDEVQKYYNRDSTVVFPPVYLERFQKPAHRAMHRKGFLVSGRHTPYKRLDIAVTACTQHNLPLTVIGEGPDTARLRKIAGNTVTFVGKVSDEVLEKEFAAAIALVFPGLDDFGITPIEAMAAGTPVIAYKGGGALDYIVPGLSGEFFEPQTAEALAQVMQQFDPGRYTSAAIRAHAQRFSTHAFQRDMTQYISKQLTQHHTASDQEPRT